jgi:hypothetical protein
MNGELREVNVKKAMELWEVPEGFISRILHLSIFFSTTAGVRGSE